MFYPNNGILADWGVLKKTAIACHLDSRKSAKSFAVCHGGFILKRFHTRSAGTVQVVLLAEAYLAPINLRYTADRLGV